jgi:3-carboxymethyl-3-hydroxy-acyl-[acp] dehydratase
VAPNIHRVVLPRVLSWADIDRMADSLRSAAATRVLVLQGEGGVFCEGGALDDTEEARPRRFADLLAALQRDPRPVVALVDGPALGAGAGLAAAADIVIATPRATFGLPETLLGLIPAMVFPPIARRIGIPRARRLALGAEPLAAGEALLAGLVDEVSDDLEAALARQARRLLRMDPHAVATFKGLLADHFTAPAAYEEQAAARLQELLARPETRSRIRRFLSGHAPWPDEGPA